MGEVRPRWWNTLPNGVPNLISPAKVAASEGYEGYGVPMAVDRRGILTPIGVIGVQN